MLLVTVWCVVVVLFWFGSLRGSSDGYLELTLVLALSVIGCVAGAAQGYLSVTQRPLAILMASANFFMGALVSLAFLDERAYRRKNAREQPGQAPLASDIPRIHRWR